MFKLIINVAFLAVLLGPIAACFLIFIKYVANDIHRPAAIIEHKNYYPDYVEEKRVSQLRVVK